MELFAAGDESQMTVIRRWIDESDVFMLILGTRYGSIEPQTEKSYVHLEYEYALECRKPLFAVVRDLTDIDESHEVHKPSEPTQLRQFRARVEQKMVRFWRDPRDIKLAIHETLAEFARREEIRGWVPAHEGLDLAAISEEVTRLSAENAKLRQQLMAISPRLFNGLTFEEMLRLLARTNLTVHSQDSQDEYPLQQIARFAEQLNEAGLIELPHPADNNTPYRLTEVGKQFLLCVRNAYDTSNIEEFRA